MDLESKLSRRQIVRGATAAAVTATAFPMISFGQYRPNPASTKLYSKRAVDLVRQSLVIDMLAPLKLDFRPEYYAAPLSEKDAADFRASGITGLHNAVGMGGPDAYAETLSWIAAWQGFAARNSHVFTLVDKAADLDRAKKDGKCAVIMGLQNSEHFRTASDVKHFYQIGQRCSQLT